MANLVIGYARVSSVGQKLDVQRDALTDAGCNEIYEEKLSGKSMDRPKLEQLLTSGTRKGDTVVITKIDRLARSMTDLLSIIQEFDRRGVKFKVLDQSTIDTTTSDGRLMFQILGAFSEFETNIRRERQMAGIAKAKEKGVKFGRKSTIDSERVLALHKEGLSVRAIATEMGCSKSPVQRIIKPDSK